MRGGLPCDWQYWVMNAALVRLENRYLVRPTDLVCLKQVVPKVLISQYKSSTNKKET